MTPKQKEQFNRMREVLRRIAYDYQTPNQLYKNAGKEYGLDYVDALEMSYENIQREAKLCVKGIRAI